MKKLLSFVLLLYYSLGLQAQQQERVAPLMDITPIDTAFLKATYRYAFKQQEKRASSQMELLVGDKTQLFLGADDYAMDSLGIVLENKAYPVRWLMSKSNALPYGRSNIKWRVYTGYPAGRVTILDRIFTTHYLSEEPITIPVWKTHPDSTKQVMGYTCHLAELDLHGRHWYAWYTPEVACSRGPWLLHGLPGLVVQAYDSEHLHDFLLFGLEQRAIPIGFKKSSYYKTSRERVIKEYIKFAQDPGKVIEGSGLVKPIGKQPKAGRPKRTYFFIPLRRVTP